MDIFASSFYYIALIATILFVLKLLIFALIGGDTEIETDFTDATESDTSFEFLSIQAILAFLMGFGWMGLACIKHWDLNNIYVVLIAATVGFILMYLTAKMMSSMKKLNHVVKKDYSKCVGLKGRAYTKFAPHSKGQIEINFNEQLSIEEAMNDTDNEISSFSNVKVTKYENGILYIEQE